MDSLTHALIIAIPLSLIGRPDLAIYGITGAVLIDVDVLLGLFPDRDPRLYIYTHGGFTHSFFGAFVVTLLSAAVAYPLSLTFPSMMAPFGLQAIVAIGAGAITHIAADYLAYPGIPLFYPATDKKYTLGILAGPSIYIMAASFAYIAAMAMGLASYMDFLPYVAIFGLVISISAGSKAWAATKVKGRTIATMNPTKWMVIEDMPKAYRFYTYDLFKGASHAESYEKYRGLTPGEAMRFTGTPEVRRLRYNSYIVTVEKNGNVITYRDPVRENGHIWYPPRHKSQSVTAE